MAKIAKYEPFWTQKCPKFHNIRSIQELLSRKTNLNSIVNWRLHHLPFKLVLGHNSSCIHRILWNLGHFLAQMSSYFAIFAIFIRSYKKKNIIFVIFLKNCVDWSINHNISLQKKISKFSPWGTPQGFFRKKRFSSKLCE